MNFLAACGRLLYITGWFAVFPLSQQPPSSNLTHIYTMYAIPYDASETVCKQERARKRDQSGEGLNREGYKKKEQSKKMMQAS